MNDVKLIEVLLSPTLTVAEATKRLGQSEPCQYPQPLCTCQACRERRIREMSAA